MRSRRPRGYRAIGIAQPEALAGGIVVTCGAGYGVRRHCAHTAHHERRRAGVRCGNTEVRGTLEQARRHRDRRAIDALTKIGPPPYSGNWQKAFLTQRRLLGRYGGEIHGSRNGAFGLVFRSLLFSREYTLADRINFFRGIFGSLRLLGPQLLDVDLFTSAPEIAVPVFLMEGRHDHEAPSEIAEKYFDSLKAPSKELIWFEESAHMPNSEERDLFNRVMLETVLPIAIDEPAASD